jgi:hypothetical protein
MSDRSDQRVRRPRLGAVAGLAALMAWRILRRYRILPRRTAAHAGAQHANPITDYERSDWRLGIVAWVYAGTVALLVICAFVLIAAYPTSLPDADRALRIAPPGPRLQTNPAADLERFRADEQKKLDGYTWVDREKGTVRMPIREAMKKLVATGIPGFPKADQ